MSKYDEDIVVFDRKGNKSTIKYLASERLNDYDFMLDSGAIESVEYTIKYIKLKTKLIIEKHCEV